MGADMYIFNKNKNPHSIEKLNKLIILAGPKGIWFGRVCIVLRNIHLCLNIRRKIKKSGFNVGSAFPSCLLLFLVKLMTSFNHILYIHKSMVTI